MKTRIALLALVSALAVSTGSARGGGPFYLVPSPTKECLDISNCKAVFGPWVVVPASGEATFLMACYPRFNYVVGGTDSRASSSAVRVWFDGRLGGAIGVPPTNVLARSSLLFHASSENGRVGSFLPILGCVSLRPATKQATYSVRRAAATPGTAPSAPLDLRANNRSIDEPVMLVGTGCAPHEKVIGAWSAISFNTTEPPARSFVTAATARITLGGNKVHATVNALPNLLAPLAPTASVQVGAMCQPS